MAVNLSSLTELADHLESKQAKLRVAVLQALCQQTAELCRMGKKLHPQLIALLHEHYRKAPTTAELKLCTSMILQSHEPIKLKVAEEQFLSCEEQAILVLCAEVLAGLPVAQRVALLTPVLMGQDRLVRQRLAANLLSDCQSMLAADVLLRVAILSDHHVPLPLPSVANLKLWSKELAGPYRLNVRRILGRQGEAVLRLFLENWAELTAADALWVLDRLLRGNALPEKNILLDILSRSNDGPLLRKALSGLAFFALTPADEKVIAALYPHRDPLVGAAALLIGQAELPWEHWLAPDVDDRLRGAVLQRIARQRFLSSLPFLDPLLGAGNWKIRSRVGEALAALAPASLPLLQAHLHGAEGAAKVTAAQTLQRLGQEQMLLQALS
ncbi:hypothetical protein [Pelobacter seleniigenes]|uniref:hypothetical protein n=1 Tax=Pelobacter seleniigenes TaxID=407188 RepID=UPI0004A6E38B|nr:hypothetical protein [Pelobacter seleniigenes]